MSTTSNITCVYDGASYFWEHALLNTHVTFGNMRQPYTHVTFWNMHYYIRTLQLETCASKYACKCANHICTLLFETCASIYACYNWKQHINYICHHIRMLRYL